MDESTNNLVPMDSHDRSGEEPYPSYGPTPASRPWLKYAVIGGVIVVLLAIGGGYLLMKRGNAAQPAVTTAGSQNTTSPTVMPDQAGDSSQVSYTSNGSDLKLSFSYPSGWNVTPASGSNSSDQPITVTSPLVSLAISDDTSVTGKVVVQIRSSSAELSELAGDKASIAQNSVQIAYDKPTSSQHQYPFITFINLTGGANPSSGFQEVMITGVTSFTKAQALTSDSLGGLDPIITATFYRCSAQTCSGDSVSPLSISDGTWQDNATAKQALAIFQSLKIS